MFRPPEPPVPMSLPYRGARMAWAIGIIGWDNNQFADRLGMSKGSMRQMLTDKRFIPDILALWLETLVAVHLALPKPITWHDNLPEHLRRDADGNRWVRLDDDADED